MATEGFIIRLKKHINSVKQMSDKFSSIVEESTKTALVMPFFAMLGYNVFNIEEFVPEYTCDVAGKKGEKVDYAIMENHQPVVLIEAKRAGLKLQEQHQGQLFRYFTTSRARLALLTNGVDYKFFSDTDNPNIMDSEPFLSFNLLSDDIKVYADALEMFCKKNFSQKDFIFKASYLKVASKVESIFLKDLDRPSDRLVKYFLSYPELGVSGIGRQQVIEQYRDAILMAMTSAIRGKMPTVESKEIGQVDKEPTNACYRDTAKGVCKDHLGNEFRTLKDMLAYHGVADGTFYQRLKGGSTLGEALAPVSSKRVCRTDVVSVEEEYYSNAIVQGTSANSADLQQINGDFNQRCLTESLQDTQKIEDFFTRTLGDDITVELVEKECVANYMVYDKGILIRRVRHSSLHKDTVDLTTYSNGKVSLRVYAKLSEVGLE